MKQYRDGSIKFSRPLDIVLEDFIQDPSNPCRYLPDYPPCTLRYQPLRKTPCGKINKMQQTCKLSEEVVSVKFCKACTVRVPP